MQGDFMDGFSGPRREAERLEDYRTRNSAIVKQKSARGTLVEGHRP
jgi:hypothetical protein